MPSTFFFIVGTLLLPLNLIRPFGLAVSDWFYFISMALAVVETIVVDKQNRHVWFTNRFLWFAFLILLGYVLSLVNSINYSIAIFEIIQQLYVITVFVSLIWIMVNRGQMKRILFTFIMSGVFAASIAFMDYVTGSRLGPMLSNTPDIQLWGRFAGPLGHPNKLGYFLVITGMLTLSRVKDAKGSGMKFLWIVLFLVQTFGIYLSGSVTAFVGFIFGLLAFLLASSRKRTTPIKVFSGLVILILIITMVSILSGNAAVLNFFESIWDNIDKSLHRVQLSTADSRIESYTQALEYIYKSPLIGIGTDQISTSGAVNRLLDVHNVFIQTWYVGGILSLIGLLGIYIWIGFSALKTLLPSRLGIPPSFMVGLASAALAIILMDQFQDSLYQREKWLSFGLFAVYLWAKKKVGNEAGILDKRV